MKEYKTLRVSPEEETDTLTAYARFGWKLEDSREVYNESQEIIGVDEKVTSYGSFMRGFTGNDGKVETQVRTKTNVTHYITLRFSRETSIKDYDRLVAMENEFFNPKESVYIALKQLVKNKSPILFTVIAVIALIVVGISLIQIIAGVEPELWEIVVCAAVAVIAIVGTVVSWVLYKKNYSKKAKQNEIIAQENKEIEAENEKIKTEYNAERENLLVEVNKILEEHGLNL